MLQRTIVMRVMVLAGSCCCKSKKKKKKLLKTINCNNLVGYVMIKVSLLPVFLSFVTWNKEMSFILRIIFIVATRIRTSDTFVDQSLSRWQTSTQSSPKEMLDFCGSFKFPNSHPVAIHLQMPQFPIYFPLCNDRMCALKKYPWE